jgi:hypothetical protein
MKRIALTAAVFLATASAALATPATVTTMPQGYQQIRASLVQQCGPARAQTIANLVWDEDIHIVWEHTVTADPSQAKAMGDTGWHRYWVSVYRSAIKLLIDGCAPGTQVPQTFN